MSQTPIDPGAPAPPPRQRDGCLVFVLVLVGLVLLLPGVCALFFVTNDPSMLTDSTGLALVIVCLAIAAGGVALMWMAVRRPTP